MEDVTGEVFFDIGGHRYQARLTSRAIGQLQKDLGRDFLDAVDLEKGQLPDMLVCLRIVEEALFFGGAPREMVPGLADAILDEDFNNILRVLKAYPMFRKGIEAEEAAARLAAAGEAEDEGKKTGAAGV